MTRDPKTDNGKRATPARKIRLRRADRPEGYVSRVPPVLIPEEPKPDAEPEPKPESKGSKPDKGAVGSWAAQVLNTEGVVPVGSSGGSPGSLRVTPGGTMPLTLPTGSALRLDQEPRQDQELLDGMTGEKLVVPGPPPAATLQLTVPSEVASPWVAMVFGDKPADRKFFLTWEGTEKEIGPLHLVSMQFQQFATAPDVRVFDFLLAK